MALLGVYYKKIKDVLKYSLKAMKSDFKLPKRFWRSGLGDRYHYRHTYSDPGSENIGKYWHGFVVFLWIYNL